MRTPNGVGWGTANLPHVQSSGPCHDRAVSDAKDRRCDPIAVDLSRHIARIEALDFVRKMPAFEAYRSPRKVYFALTSCLLGLTGDGVVGEECYRAVKVMSQDTRAARQSGRTSDMAILGPEHVSRLPV
jgi:hypothetical protein